MDTRKYQRKRSFRRPLVTLLALVMLLSVCFPALVVSAGEVESVCTVTAGDQCAYSPKLPEGATDVKAEVPQDNGLAVSFADGKFTVKAVSAEPGQYTVKFTYADAQGVACGGSFKVEVVAPIIVVSESSAQADAAVAEIIQVESAEASVQAAQPAEPTETPVETTEAPAETTEAPVETTEAPVETTEAPVETTEATEPVAETTEAAEPTAETTVATEPEITTEEDSASAEAMKATLTGQTVEQGIPVTVQLSQTPNIEYSRTFTCAVTQNGSAVTSGFTFDYSSGSRNVTISVGDSVTPGVYTISFTYYYYNGWRYTSITDTLTMTVTEKTSSGGSGTGTGSVEPITPSVTKTVTKTATTDADGIYDLELTIAAGATSVTQKIKMDVVFIVDCSGSMETGNRIGATRTAMTNFVNGVEAKSEDIDAQYAIIRFGTIAQQYQGFSNAVNTRNSISGIRTYNNGWDEGTNYEFGIERGKQTLNTGRSDAIKVVIFLTDGVPTFRGITTATSNNSTLHNDILGTGTDDDGGDDYFNNRRESAAGANINAATNAVRTLNCHYFYAIGIGSTGNNPQALVNNVPATTGKAVYNGTDDLSGVFSEIASQITTYRVSNVTVTDTISEYVDVRDATWMVHITDKDGTTVKGPDVSVTDNGTTISAAYDPETRQLKMIFSNSTYELNENYVYKLVAKIKPTEEAYTAYRTSGYPHTGDAGTGTHDGDVGFYSNTSAVADYTFNGTPGTVTYPKPVVQLKSGSLTITKQFVGVETIPSTSFTVELAYGDRTTEQRTLTIGGDASDFILNDDGTYTCTIPVWSYNTSYSVTEVQGAVDGMDVTTTVDGENSTDLTATGTIAWQGAQTVAYVNTYTPSGHNVTISKTVQGNMGDYSRAFKFTVQSNKEMDEVLNHQPTGSDVIYTVVNNGDGTSTITFTLTHGQTVLIEQVPDGADLTVMETDVQAYEVVINGDSVKKQNDGANATKVVTISDKTAISVTNILEADIDTGVTDSAYPFILLLSATLAAGFLFLLHKRRYVGKF